MIIFPLILASQYNPTYYENPFNFDPERWMKEDGSIKNPEPFTWIPFSAGPRTCIGRQLAEMEMKIIVIKFLK